MVQSAAPPNPTNIAFLGWLVLVPKRRWYGSGRQKYGDVQKPTRLLSPQAGEGKPGMRPVQPVCLEPACHWLQDGLDL